LQNVACCNGGLEPALQKHWLLMILSMVFPVVVPLSHRTRRVKVEASCGANLAAPTRDAG
jgi:hypothetical protein